MSNIKVTYLKVEGGDERRVEVVLQNTYGWCIPANVNDLPADFREALKKWVNADEEDADS